MNLFLGTFETGTKEILRTVTSRCPNPYDRKMQDHSVTVFPMNINTQSVLVEAKGTTERRMWIEIKRGVQAGSSVRVQCLQTQSHTQTLLR